MELALMIEGQEGVTWEQWLALARACEEHGVGTMFRSDHYVSFTAPDRAGSLDAWTQIAALATQTTTLRLGTLVSPATFRHPSVLAKAVVTADHVSQGRVELGLGAGWMVPEHEQYGFPFPPTSERVAMLAEQLEIVARSWTEDRLDFEGRHYRLRGLTALPRPVQQPRPPLIVGGSGKPGTLRPAVRWADEYNTTFATTDELRERKQRLAEVLRDEQRDPQTMRFSLMTGLVVGETRAEALERARVVYERQPRDASFDDWVSHYSKASLVGSVDEVGERLKEIEATGVDRVMLQHLVHEDLEPVRLIGRELAR
ncbi:MAG TPA: TIGR03560 family F420-dependent LLM class oxidoreductase [Gaiellaceae bacterium]